MDRTTVPVLIFLVLMGGGLSGTTSAQSASPGVDLVCESSSVRLDVGPGADRSG